MDLSLKQRFLDAWCEHFGDADLPVALWYSDQPIVPLPALAERNRCFIAYLRRVFEGAALSVDVDSIGCMGGKRHLGFTETLSPTIHYFLSCGIPGKLEGERYKKTPEIAQASIARSSAFHAPGKYLNARRWDQLQREDTPQLVVFFAGGDVLSGLFTLANFDREDTHGVIAPFGAGCSAVVYHPFTERSEARPRAVLGMFDPSARPHIGPEKLSFAVPMERFGDMVGWMPESFLIAPAWRRLSERFGGHAVPGDARKA